MNNKISFKDATVAVLARHSGGPMTAQAIIAEAVEKDGFQASASAVRTLRSNAHRRWSDIVDIATEGGQALISLKPSAMQKFGVKPAAAEKQELAPANEDMELNEFQKPYEPLSKADVPSTMIPRELDSAYRKALDRVTATYGDIDSAMAQEFGYELEDFKAKFAPEQIDALALAVSAEARGRGFLIADGTGVGKGRPLAALMVRALNQGKKVIFISEKDANLSDIQRDMKHIGRLERVTPLVLNGIDLIDETDGKPFAAHTRETVKGMLSTMTWPAGVDVVYATYSQFNRKVADSKKAEWLDQAVTEDTVLIVDEIHNAASGTSNTSGNIYMAINRAGSVFYSSATHAATSRMVAFYERLFPDDMDSAEMGRLVARGGEPLQEVLTNMLVSDGVMTRRERDLSSIGFSQEIDLERMEESKKYMDALSDVIAQIAETAVEVLRMVRGFNDARDEDDTVEYRMYSFGMTLHSLTRFASACLVSPFAAERAVQALENGEKPVIMADSTVQAVLEQCLGGEGPDFKMVVHRTFDRLMTVHQVEHNPDGSETLTEVPLAEETLAMADQVRAAIDTLPPLPAYPIDIVKQKILESGRTCGEITGRAYEMEDGVVVPRTDRDRTTIKNRFNSGEFDALIMNVSSSTGVDLHSSNRFKDQRRRVFIEMQAPQSVQKQVQAFGRISRKNEAVPPRIEFLSAGLPGEIRLSAMRNKRLRRMSANVTSNRDSAFLTKNIPDIINHVGDAVITRYAEMRPDLVRKLCMDEDSLGKQQKEVKDAKHEAGRDVKHSANTFLSRLSLLPTQKQEEIIGELFAEYEFHIAELESKGENPLRPREIDGIVHMGERTVFEGNPELKTDSVFEKPLYLQDVKIERTVDPITSDAVLDALDEGAALFGSVMRCIERLRKHPELYLETCLTGGYRTVAEALAEDDARTVKVSGDIRTIIAAVPHLKPGRGITVQMPDDTVADAVVAAVLPPKPGFEHMPHQYRVRVAIPGEVIIRTFFLSSLLKMKSVALPYAAGTLGMRTRPALAGDDYEKELAAFDEATATRYRTAKLFTSNIYAAVRIAVKHKAGVLTSLTDSNGIQHKAVLVKKGFEKKLAHLPLRVDGEEAVRRALKERVLGMTTAPGSTRFGVNFNRKADSDKWEIRLPKPRTRGDRTLWRTEDYAGLYKSGKLKDTGVSIITVYGVNEALRLAEIVLAAGYQSFYVDPRGLSRYQRKRLFEGSAWRDPDVDPDAENN